ncbi:MAG: PDZ domain-containing protein, partial [Phycisphaerae bacterium]
QPLQCDTTRKGPYSAILYRVNDGLWTTSVRGVGGGVTTVDDGRRFTGISALALIVDKAGKPVTIAGKSELPLDESWKIEPGKWPTVSAAELATQVAGLEKRAGAGLVRVTMNFRSPKGGEDRNNYRSYRGRGSEQGTVQHVLGVLVDEKTVLVLSELHPTTTARLESLRVQGDDGKGVDAKFKGALTDYGAFVITLEKPLTGAITFSEESILKSRDRLLLAAEVTQQGEKRTAYFSHARIPTFRLGWHQNFYPELSGSSTAFLFNDAGTLVALPISQRPKGTEDRYGSNQSVLTAAAQIKAVLAAGAASFDPSNTPLTEEEENRLAWLGIELQPLTQELARANNVSDQTSDGENGALVTYVYPNSPAAKAGIEAGCVLLRIHTPEQPKPIEVHLDSDSYGERSFPWERLGQAPESVFDQIPAPWPAVENTLIRTMTDLGFGKKIQAEFFVDGKVVTKEFEVVQSPPHWNAAAKFKSVPLGITVRNMTYEVSRYFHRKDGEPGVVISKIEMGSKASIAGLKPYEYVTHVNDQPVANVRQFEQQMKTVGDAGGEVRLSVTRMAQGRLVKVRLPAATTTSQPATQSASQPATAP